MRAGGSQSPAPINLSSGSVFSMAWKTSMHMPLTLARPSTIELMNLGSELICAVVRISVTAAAPPAHSDDSRHIELTICRSGFMAMISWMGGLLRVARGSEKSKSPHRGMVIFLQCASHGYDGERRGYRLRMLRYRKPR